jgi:DNA-binding NtrC family response regulator
MERAVLLATGDSIQPRDLRLEWVSAVPSDEKDESRLTFREVQRLHIERVLTTERWNIARAATRLGMTRSSLYNKIKTFGLVHPNGNN